MKKYDLLFFLGQSNMQGQSEKQVEIPIIKKAYEYKYLTNSLSTISYPLGENIKYDFTAGFEVNDDIPGWINNHIVGASVNKCYNLMVPFLINYAKLVDNELIACHIAKGSTVIEYWSYPNDGYKAIIKKGKAAIDYIGKENIDKIYVIFLQGESDAVAQTKKDDYLNALITLKNNLKKELFIDKFTIIRVGKFAMNEHDLSIQSAQEEACKGDSDFVMLTRVTDKLLDKPDLYCSIYGHYNPAAFDIIGKIAGTNLASYKLNKSFIDDII